MGLFNWKIKPELSDAQVRVAERIASHFLSAQRRLADRINAAIGSVPIKVLSVFLICLGFVFGIYCAFLLLSAFF